MCNDHLSIKIFSIARRLGILMARIHMLNVPIAKEPMCVEVADGWLRKLETLYGKMAHKMRVKMVDVDLKKVNYNSKCCRSLSFFQVIVNKKR